MIVQKKKKQLKELEKLGPKMKGIGEITPTPLFSRVPFVSVLLT